MLNGAHVILYSSNPEADRAFFRDILQLSNIDIGGGWLLFKSPPSEIAFHPAEKSGACELYFMCDDIEAFLSSMNDKGVNASPVEKQNWGLLTKLRLPGGADLGVYQPLHERA